MEAVQGRQLVSLSGDQKQLPDVIVELCLFELALSLKEVCLSLWLKSIKTDDRQIRMQSWSQTEAEYAMYL